MSVREDIAQAVGASIQNDNNSGHSVNIDLPRGISATAVAITALLYHDIDGVGDWNVIRISSPQIVNVWGECRGKLWELTLSEG